MRLLEYQSKAIFSDYGIPIPTGYVTSNAIHAKKISSQFSDHVVLKAQVHTRGRGKKGGIRLVKNLDDVEATAIDMLGSKINGTAVNKIMVEEAVNIEREFILSISIDFENQCPTLSVSRNLTNFHPSESNSQKIDLLFGPQEFQIRNAAIFLEIENDLWDQFSMIVKKIWEIFSSLDAQIIDVKPLAITSEKKLVVLDARIDVDDLALARHPEIYKIYDTGIDDEIEIESHKYGIQIIHETGEIACLTMGKGIAAALYDHFQNICSLEAAIIDLGSDANSEKINASLQMLQEKNQIKAIFLNIFCEFSNPELLIEEILTSSQVKKTQNPVVIVINDPKFNRILTNTGKENIKVENSMIIGIHEICRLLNSD